MAESGKARKCGEAKTRDWQRVRHPGFNLTDGLCTPLRTRHFAEVHSQLFSDTGISGLLGDAERV